MQTDRTLKQAIALHRDGRIADAETIYRQILSQEAGHADALNLLGTIQRQRGNLREAIDLTRKALQSSPRSSLLHFNLGECYRASGLSGEAVGAYRDSLSIRGEDAQVHLALAHAYADHRRFEEAISCFHKAISLRPKHCPAYHDLIALLMQLNRLDDANQICGAALLVMPRDGMLYGRLAAIRAEQQRWAEARDLFEHAILYCGGWAAAHAGLAQALNRTGEYRAAEVAAAAAIQIDCKCVRAQIEFGVAMERKGHPCTAAIALSEALRLHPDHVEAHENLGSALLQQLEQPRAIFHFRRAIELSPASASTHGTLLLAMNYAESLDPATHFAEHQRWAAVHASAPRLSRVHGAQPRTAEGRALRIGYVSADLRNHPVPFFFEPVLQFHDRATFAPVVFCDVVHPDSITAQLQTFSTEWHDTHALDTEQFGEFVHSQQIDILVDLSGHTAKNRLLALASRPAPVQVTYLGYPNTTGLPREIMQFRLTDAICDPPGQSDALHSEELLRLPAPFLCYKPPAASPPVACALIGSSVMFGCFNGMMKITSDLIEIWCSILGGVPGSHLMLKNRSLCDPKVCRKVETLFAHRGVAAERLVLRPPEETTYDHLARYNDVHIALDTYPYHGTTTTCEALWMGVPVITRTGATHRSRVGASLLSSVGLESLVARTREDYIRLATTLALDEGRLRGIRVGLHERVSQSRLMDAPRFVASLEAQYRLMWQRAMAPGGSR